MLQFDYIKAMQNRRYKWLVTGVAGFIGSHILETLLKLDQTVIGLDNFSTGLVENLKEVERSVGSFWSNFKIIEGDIRSFSDCKTALEGVNFLLHQAAISSVPFSINHPILTHQVNVSGFLNLMQASMEQGVNRIVYASSSSVYGESGNLPLSEAEMPRPISPYAASKAASELYAEAFYKTYGLELIGLRYFNVFGRRQNPAGPYAAVIPKWIEDMSRGESVFIYGDGTQTRDFLHVSNVVHANLMAAFVDKSCAGQVFNIGLGKELKLSDLFQMIRQSVKSNGGQRSLLSEPIYLERRKGDIEKSAADITKASKMLGYQPVLDLKEGLNETTKWFSSIQDESNLRRVDNIER